MSNFTTKEINSLVALLRYGLFGGPLPQVLPTSEAQWQSLYDLTRQQAITALAYDAILRLPADRRPPRKVLFHFTSLVQTIESDNRQREKALSDLATICNERLGLQLTVVKGSSLASRYPKPLHRECGDNDLFTGADTGRLKTLLESMGIAIDSKDPRHIAFVYENTTFEAHTYLLYHNDDPQWHSDQSHSAYSVLRPDEEAFFLAKHCEHHSVFFHNPVRLRTLIDWCLLLKTEGFDFARFDRLKKGTDVEVFADLMTLYCNELFGVGLRNNTDMNLKNLGAADFEKIYMHCPERHKLALVRVTRRSAKYILYWRKYRMIYGQSMFRRFYFNNLKVAAKQHRYRR